jgi:hypothetical protein
MQHLRRREMLSQYLCETNNFIFLFQQTHLSMEISLWTKQVNKLCVVQPIDAYLNSSFWTKTPFIQSPLCVEMKRNVMKRYHKHEWLESDYFIIIFINELLTFL